MDKKIIEVSNLKKSFTSSGREFHVLKGIDMEISPGELVAVVGVSGVGKTTLLHTIGGLERPTSGKVIFEDKDIFSLSDDELSRFRGENIGFVFQFYNLFKEFSVMENILLPFLVNKKQPDPDFVREILKKIGLLGKEDRTPFELSGGERQRVAIARALVAKPKVIIADEPTGNLDSERAKEIMEIFCEIREQFGITVIVATHDLDLVLGKARVLKIVDGKIEK